MTEPLCTVCGLDDEEHRGVAGVHAFAEPSRGGTDPPVTETDPPKISRQDRDIAGRHD